MKIQKENTYFFILFLFVSFGFLTCGFLTPAKAQSVVLLESKREQSAVFERPNFDAEILYLLPKGKKLPGTRSTVAGDNGLGLFHKVKLNSSTYGYMLDTEVQIVGSKESKKKNQITTDPPKNKTLKSSSSTMNSKKQTRADTPQTQTSRELSPNLDSQPKKKSLGSGLFLRDSKELDYSQEEIAEARAKKEAEAAEKKKQKEIAKKREKPKDPKTMTPYERYVYETNLKRRKKNEKPFFMKTMIGAQAGMVKYTEKVTAGKKSSNELVYGIKVTGPNVIFKNFMVDLSVNLHFGAPSYYNDFSTEGSGFFALVDLTLPFVLSRTERRFVYGGIGPVLNVSMFDFKVLGQQESSQKLSLGGVATFGLAYQLGESWALKAEGKYYFERASYWGILAGIQKTF